MDPQDLGIFWGVSVGTGDPENLTIKAIKILQSVPVITLPHNPQRGSSRAYDIIKSWLPQHLLQEVAELGIPSQQVIPLELPFVRDPNVLQQAWGSAVELIWQTLSQGEDVAFACEGDVGLYSTFGHLAQMMRERHPDVEIRRVPGVTSPLAAAAELGIPLGVVDEAITILPALYDVGQLEAALEGSPVVVLLKVKPVYAQVWQILQQRNLLHKSYLAIEIGNSNAQYLRGLEDHRNLDIPYFSTLIIRQRDP